MTEKLLLSATRVTIFIKEFDKQTCADVRGTQKISKKPVFYLIKSDFTVFDLGSQN